MLSIVCPGDTLVTVAGFIGLVVDVSLQMTNVVRTYVNREAARRLFRLFIICFYRATETY